MTLLNTEDGKSSEEVKVDLDTILVDEIGQFGKYQLRVIALCGILALFSGAALNEYVFTAARIATRCLIPECDEATPSFAPPWILNAIPGSSAASFDSCERYANTSSELDQTCPASLFDQQATQPCDQYVYENTDTVVHEFGLACDEWRRTLIGSILTFGTLVALPITGFISDRWGRKTALVFNAFNSAWIGIARYWTDTYAGFVIAQFAQAAFGAGVLSSAYILVMEIVGPKYRRFVGAITNSSFAIGQICLGLIAWKVSYWRSLTLTLFIPQVISFAYFWILSESVRWLMSKGRLEESEKILINIARVNGKELLQSSIESLRQTAKEEEEKAEKLEVINEPWLPILVFRHKPILLRCLVSPIWWITMTFVFYGMAVNAVNIAGNPFLNYVFVAVIDIPANFFSAIMIGIVGRKPVLITGYLICALCQISFVFMPDDLFGLSLTVYLIGKFCIAMVATALYVYTSELYPTRYRHSLFAFSSMIGRIGSITAPLTPALSLTVWEPMPFVMFASLCLVSGLLCFITPETLGTKLPDTMEQAANMTKQK